MSDQKSYRSIMKATTVFGGIQVFQILITMVRGKFAAMLLGPAGMGIANLFMSSIDMVTRATSFGLSTSAIPDIAKANGDPHKLGRILVIFRRLLLLTGILGTVSVLILSPFLSKWTFGNNNQIVSYIFLSSMLLMGSFSVGYQTILRGTQRVKLIAIISFWSSIVGLFITVPLYYYFRTSGIVPSLILTTLSALLITHFLSKKHISFTSDITWLETIREGKSMLGLGFLLSVGALAGALVTYILNLFISSNGSTADVGLFQAAMAMTNQYTGLVFTAMVGDYLPRLSSTIDNRAKTQELVNQQAEITLLLITPLLLLLILCAPLLVKILLTDEFTSIIPIIRWIALGTIFKGASFALGFIIIAKEDKKLFFYLEGVVMNVILLLLNITFYHFWGLTGLGISFVILYAISLVTYVILCQFRYKVRFTKELLIMIFFMLIMTSIVLALLTSNLFPGSTFLSILIASVVIGKCFQSLEQKLSIISMLKNKLGNS